MRNYVGFLQIGSCMSHIKQFVYPKIISSLDFKYIVNIVLLKRLWWLCCMTQGFISTSLWQACFVKTTGENLLACMVI